MYKLEVTLKQHTPLIHFQHDQKGATLRASEVKPKLDKFILNKLGNGVIDVGILTAKNNGWLIEGQEKALNYKIRIIPLGIRKNFIIASRLVKNQPALLKTEGYEVIESSQYFAQEKEYSQLFEKIDRNDRYSDYKFKFEYKLKLKQLSKKGIQYENLESVFMSFDISLINCICDIIPEFFVAENFGTRNGKGFGSYTVKSIVFDGKPVIFKEEIDTWLLKNYSIVYKKSAKTLSPFYVINKDYKLMKSGYGRYEKPENYQKSLIFQYFAKDNKRWEKRWFKQQIKPLTLPGNDFEDYTLKQDRLNGDPVDVNFKQSWNDKACPYNKIDNYYYIRALLGLAESFDFLTDDSTKKISVKLQFDKEYLERFKSPVIFKIIENNIYLVGNDTIPTQFLHDHSPEFLIAKKDNDKIVQNSEKSIGGGALIKIPPTFSLNDFISFCIKGDNKNLPKINGYQQLKANYQ
jgi:hypothetical protein